MNNRAMKRTTSSFLPANTGEEKEISEDPDGDEPRSRSLSRKVKAHPSDSRIPRPNRRGISPALENAGRQMREAQE